MPVRVPDPDLEYDAPPGHRPSSAVGAVQELGGIAHVTALDRFTTRALLRRAVREERLVRLSPGWYALPTAEKGLAAARRVSGVASHLSAAAYWGWEVKEQPAVPQVSVPRGRKVDPDTRREIAVRWRNLPPRAATGGVTTPLRTVLDCARDLPFDAGLAVADSALRRREIRAEELREAAAAVRGPGATRVRRVARCADGRADNPFESVLRAFALDAGLDVLPQQPVDVGAFTAKPDLLDLGRSLAIEADSWTYHAEKSAFVRDCERYNLFVLAGYRVLRFTREQVMEREAATRAMLADAARLSSG